MSLQYVYAVCHFHPYYCNTKILIACRPLSHTTKASFLKLSQNGMDLITKTANRIAKTSVMHLNPPSWPPAFLQLQITLSVTQRIFTLIANFDEHNLSSVMCDAKTEPGMNHIFSVVKCSKEITSIYISTLEYIFFILS